METPSTAEARRLPDGTIARLKKVDAGWTYEVLMPDGSWKEDISVGADFTFNGEPLPATP